MEIKYSILKWWKLYEDVVFLLGEYDIHIFFGD
jgi:hypothetical protein